MPEPDIFQSSLQTLAELREKVASARRAYDEELTFAQKLADRLNREIPEEYLIRDTFAYDFGSPLAILDQVGSTPRYSNVHVDTGEFFGRPLTESVRIILDRAPRNIMAWDSIVELLRAGGFPRIRTDADVQVARNNILKSSTFVLIPDNNFGLTSVYGGKKKAGRKSKEEKEAEQGTVVEKTE